MKTVIIKGKEWNKDLVKALLLRNNKAIYKALTLLYSFQTTEEQILEEANTHNGKGFTKFDAEILSSFARQINNGKTLSDKQTDIARKRIIKYTNQIFNYMLSENS